MAWVEYKNSGYFVSENGEIKNKKGRILSPQIRNKYRFINLSGCQLSIHRIVAECFIQKIVGYDYVNHINGIKTDNRACNLEWCNRSQNQKHAYRTGLQKPKKSFNNVSSKSVAKLLNGSVIDVYGSLSEAAIVNGIKSYTNISRCCNGERIKSHGYNWMFVNLPSGSIEKLIGRKLTWGDEPVEVNV